MTSLMSRENNNRLPGRLLISVRMFLFALLRVSLHFLSLKQEPGGAGGESVAQSPAGAGKSKVMIS